MTLPESRQLDFNEIPIIDIGRLLDGDGAGEVVRAIDSAWLTDTPISFSGY